MVVAFTTSTLQVYKHNLLAVRFPVFMWPFGIICCKVLFSHVLVIIICGFTTNFTKLVEILN